MKLSAYLESQVTKYIKLQEKQWMPGLIALVRAVDKGDDVGILTARANKSANVSILKAIQKMVRKLSQKKDFRFSRKHVHFVNDKGYEKYGSNSADRKAGVIGDYIDDYDSVKFYDDEEKNLLKAKEKIKSSFDIKKFDAKKLEEPKKNDKKKLHLFDLDKTIINSPANIKVKKDGKIVKEYSQEEFAELGSYELPENETWDFSDFTNKDIIDDYMRSYRVFKNETN